ncbi:MAG: hypothetical protein AAGC79_19280 [Pseudomonadota bacterium]
MTNEPETIAETDLDMVTGAGPLTALLLPATQRVPYEPKSTKKQSR